MTKPNGQQIAVMVVAIFALAALGVGAVYYLYKGLPVDDGVTEEQFLVLREKAKEIKVGMTLAEVTELLGEPDFDREWLKILPNWRLYYYDGDPEVNSGEVPRSYVTVLIDTEEGVQTVDVYDPVFNSCNGNKIDESSESINRKHHDRFAGPVIVSG